ncbi:MAG: hypothetical protein ACRDRS_22465 [Pseudonocardiaceae bacterium]
MIVARSSIVSRKVMEIVDGMGENPEVAHQVKVFRVRSAEGAKNQAVCACGWKSTAWQMRELAVMDGEEHLKEYAD